MPISFFRLNLWSCGKPYNYWVSSFAIIFKIVNSPALPLASHVTTENKPLKSSFEPKIKHSGHLMYKVCVILYIIEVLMLF